MLFLAANFFLIIGMNLLLERVFFTCYIASFGYHFFAPLSMRRAFFLSCDFFHVFKTRVFFLCVSNIRMRLQMRTFKNRVWKICCTFFYDGIITCVNWRIKFLDTGKGGVEVHVFFFFLFLVSLYLLYSTF